MTARSRFHPAVAPQLHQLQRRENRRQRVAQLVSEHRHELVLGAVRRLGGFEQLAALALDARAFDRLPAPARDVAHDRDFVRQPHPRLGGVDGHRRHQPPGLQDRHADHASNRARVAHPPIVVANPAVAVAVFDDVELSGAHQAQAFGAELAKPMTADDARDVPGVVSDDEKFVLVILDYRVGAPVDVEMLAHQLRRGIRDRLGIDQLPHDVVELDEQPIGGDVLDDAEHPFDYAVLIVSATAARRDPSLPAAAHHAILDGVVALRGDGLLDGPAGAFLVVGVEHASYRGPGRRLARWSAQDLRRPVRQDDQIGNRVPAPVAEPRRRQRDVQARGIGVGPVARLAQRRLGPRALRDIAHDLRDAEDRAAGVADRRQGDRHRNPLAVFPDADGLEVFDAAALADLAQEVRLFRQPVRGEQQRDVRPDGFGRGVAEDPLGPAVPGGDDSLQRLADNPIVGGLDNGGEQIGRRRLHHRLTPGWGFTTITGRPAGRRPRFLSRWRGATCGG